MSEIIQIRLKIEEKPCLQHFQPSDMFFCQNILVYVFYDYLTPVGGPLSPAERYTNNTGNCLHCLRHWRVCFRCFVQEQASSGRMATRIRCIFAELFGRIRIHCSSYCSDRI